MSHLPLEPPSSLLLVSRPNKNDAPGVTEGVTPDLPLQLVRAAVAQRRALAGRRRRGGRDSEGGGVAAVDVDVDVDDDDVRMEQQLVERILLSFYVCLRLD